MAENTVVAEFEHLFQALADRTRLRLLNLMAGHEVCVCYFVEILDVPQPTISRHLAYLRRSGLVAARRQGKWMHYRLVLPKSAYVRQVLVDTLSGLAATKDLERERARLTQACCLPKKAVALQHAPTPEPFSGLVNLGK